MRPRESATRLVPVNIVTSRDSRILNATSRHRFREPLIGGQIALQ
jgi:hypothetical protein